MIAKAKITTAEIKPSKVSPEATVLYLMFQLEEPIPFGDKVVEKLLYTVWNGLDCSKGWKRAELRRALGLKPTFLTKQIVMGFPYMVVPVFTKEDLPGLIDKKAVLNIEEELDTPFGPRLRVMHALPEGGD